MEIKDLINNLPQTKLDEIEIERLGLGNELQKSIYGLIKKQNDLNHVLEIIKEQFQIPSIHTDVISYIEVTSSIKALNTYTGLRGIGSLFFWEHLISNEKLFNNKYYPVQDFLPKAFFPVLPIGRSLGILLHNGGIINIHYQTLRETIIPSIFDEEENQGKVPTTWNNLLNEMADYSVINLKELLKFEIKGKENFNNFSSIDDKPLSLDEQKNIIDIFGNVKGYKAEEAMHYIYNFYGVDFLNELVAEYLEENEDKIPESI